MMILLLLYKRDKETLEKIGVELGSGKREIANNNVM